MHGVKSTHHRHSIYFVIYQDFKLINIPVDLNTNIAWLIRTCCFAIEPSLVGGLGIGMDGQKRTIGPLGKQHFGSRNATGGALETLNVVIGGKVMYILDLYMYLLYFFEKLIVVS